MFFAAITSIYVRRLLRGYLVSSRECIVWYVLLLSCFAHSKEDKCGLCTCGFEVERCAVLVPFWICSVYRVDLTHLNSLK